MATRELLTVTDAAKTQIRDLLAKRAAPSKGIRIGVNSKGCSGMSYTLEFVDEESSFDEKVPCEDFTIYVNPKAILFILGTQMDYNVDKMQSGFSFNNPNEKGRCGCGKSFHV